MTLGTGVARGLSGAARNLMPWLASIGAHGQGSGFYFVLKLVVVARRLAPSPHSFTDASNVLTAPSCAMSCSLSGQFVESCGACSPENPFRPLLSARISRTARRHQCTATIQRIFGRPETNLYVVGLYNSWTN